MRPIEGSPDQSDPSARASRPAKPVGAPHVPKSAAPKTLPTAGSAKTATQASPARAEGPLTPPPVSSSRPLNQSVAELSSQKDFPAGSSKPLSTEPIELVAIDVDGTLLRSDKTLNKRSANAIYKASQLGIKMVLASARPPRSVRAIYKYLKLETPSIHYNGALIHDLGESRHVFHQPLPANLTRQIIDFARRIDPTVIVSVEVLDQWYTDRPDQSLQVATSRRFNPDYIGPFLQFLRQPVTKLMLLAPPDRMERIGLGIRERYGNHVTIAISDRHLIQIIHPAVDKSTALERVAKMMKIDQQRVMAIGDAPNDIGMIRWAGLGVAVDNAWDKVRDHADVIVPANDQDGVAIAIEQFVIAPAMAKQLD